MGAVCGDEGPDRPREHRCEDWGEPRGEPRGEHGGDNPRDPTNEHAWVAPPRRGRTAILSVALMGLLGAAAWVTSGKLLERQARQEVADRYDALRICLIGEMGRLRPSEQLRLAQLAVEHSPEGLAWPSRCLPYAAALDEALQARALPASLRRLPSVKAIVEAPELRAGQLDEIVTTIEEADLPLPAHDPAVQVAPSGAPARLDAFHLEPFGAIERLGALVTARDATGLRLLFPDSEGLRLCRLDAQLEQMRCRAVPLEPPPGARLALVAGPEGAGDLIELFDAGEADGFYDAATGRIVWRSVFFDTQAVVRADRIIIANGQTRDGIRGERLEHHELIRIAPGKRPQAEQLDISIEAHLVLLPDLLLDWRDGERHAVVRARSLTDSPTLKTVAELPLESRHVAHCRGKRDVILMADGVRDRRYTLLIRDGADFTTTSVGVIAGRVDLSCHGREAVLERVREGVATRWRCGDRCLQDTTGALEPLSAPVADVGSLGERLLLLWAEQRGALRMRLGAPGELSEQRDVIVLDTPSRGGLELLSLRIIEAGPLALVLLQDASLGLHALRIDERGQIAPVRRTP